MTKILVILLLLAMLPFPIIYWLSATDRHYDDVLRGVRDAEECTYHPCKLDFDGDGITGLLKIDRASPAEYYDSSLVATENGQEIFRLPHRRLDNTLRTHVGIRSEGNRTRLIVYDRMNLPGPPLSAVFAWNGERLVQIDPSVEDQEILKAMGARDDAGEFTFWVAYRTLRLPALTVYYIVWGICAWLVLRGEKRRRLSLK